MRAHEVVDVVKDLSLHCWIEVALHLQEFDESSMESSDFLPRRIILLIFFKNIPIVMKIIKEQHDAAYICVLVGNLNWAVFCIDFEWSPVGIFTLEVVDFAVDPQRGLLTSCNIICKYALYCSTLNLDIRKFEDHFSHRLPLKHESHVGCLRKSIIRLRYWLIYLHRNTWRVCYDLDILWIEVQLVPLQRCLKFNCSALTIWYLVHNTESFIF